MIELLLAVKDGTLSVQQALDRASHQEAAALALMPHATPASAASTTNSNAATGVARTASNAAAVGVKGQDHGAMERTASVGNARHDSVIGL